LARGIQGWQLVVMADHIGPVAALIQWLQAFGIASGVARSAWVYAFVSATHVVGIALLFGSIFAVDLRLIGLTRALDDAALVLLRRIARSGVLLAAVTGVALFSTRPDEYLANPMMLAKFAVLAAALVNAIAFEWVARRKPLRDIAGTWAGRSAALLSLALWLGVIGLGRWVAFV
jgi:hypothetical protein